ncbi:MAG: hypothetical protein R3A52_26155 [Polyangiales bacterium]
MGMSVDVDTRPDAGGGCGGCPLAQTCCAGACVNLLLDRNNCGQCGRVCGGIVSCVAGLCL